MDFSRFFKSRTTIGVLAIIAGLIICFGLSPLINTLASAKSNVVFVTKEISKGSIITEDSVIEKKIGTYNLPHNVIKKKEQVVGKVAVADLFVDDYILNTKIADGSYAGDRYLYNLNGRKAISITLKSFASGLSGKLQSGDIVSVLATNNDELATTISPKELEYVKVLAATTKSGKDQLNENSSNESGEKESPSTVTLEVNNEQAEILTNLEENSKIHLALVFRGSDKEAKTYLDAQDKALQEPKTTTTQTPALNGGDQ